MGNMGYVRFENTFQDLSDCFSHLEDELSESEENYRMRLIKLCKTIVEEYDLEQYTNMVTFDLILILFLVLLWCFYIGCIVCSIKFKKLEEK